MNHYRQILKTFEAIKLKEISSDQSEGGRTKKDSREIRVMLGEIKSLITKARRELIAYDSYRKPMYVTRHETGSLFPELVLVSEEEMLDGNSQSA
jgi:hypothetical protein